MATDNTHLPHSEDSAASTNQEFNPEIVQVAQADAGTGQPSNAQPTNAQPAPIPGVPNGEVQVQIPAGQTVVRVQIAPGETIDLPFDGALAAKFGEQGNLAVKVGDQTIILLGYAEANQQEGVTLKDAKGHAVDVATVVAQTDPNLDIQTAAGPAAGASSQGGHLFLDFNPGNGLGGFNELNVINATELQYNQIQPDAEHLAIVDTSATLVSITFDANNGTVNEDDLGNHTHAVSEGAGGTSSGAITQLLTELGDALPGNGEWHIAGHGTGNDPFDQNDHEGGSQGGFQDSGNPSGLDQDREPTTAKAVVTVDFHGDVPGKVTFSNGNGGIVPVITQLTDLGLTSHGHPLSYVLLPAADGHGEIVVAYYVQDGVSNVVFTIGIEENSGATSLSDFHIDYTIYGPIDNSGAAADILNINVPFFMTDSDGPVVASPADALNFSVVDDVPELGHIQYGTQDGHTNVVEGVVHADLTIGHDETAGSQQTSYQGTDGQTHQTNDSGISASDANSLVTDGLAHNPGVADLIPDHFFIGGIAANGFDPSLFIGAAQTQLDVSFGADGKAEAGDTHSGQTVFNGDGTANAQAFELYMQGAGATGKPDSGNAADLAQNHERTNLTIDVDGKEVAVDAYQLDANTIVGIAEDGTPVFTLHLDPQSGELTLTQYHQMHNPDGSDANDPTHLLGLNDDGSTYDLVHFRATDYDGDHADGALDVSFVDDAPKLTDSNLNGHVAESALHDGNPDGYPQHTSATGSLKSTVDFGTDKDGNFSLDLDKTTGGLTQSALDSLTAQNLTSHGHDLQYKVEDGKLVGFITDSHGNAHDVFTLEVKADGTYSFTLENQLDHSGPGQDFKNIDFGNIIKATDSDGDSVILNNGQLEIHVQDDKPVATCRNEDGTVEESALPGGNRDHHSDTTIAHGSLASTVSFGADGPGKFGFAINGSDAALAHLAAQNHGLTSGGHDVHFEMQGNTLVGYIYDHGHQETVFTLNVDHDGHYTFELDRPLDEHHQGQDSTTIDFSSVITATDGDGDTITLNNGQFTVKVVDDMPEVTCNRVGGTVEESALPSGNRDHYSDTTVAHGSLASTVSFGADGPGKFAIDGSHDALAHLAAQNHGLTSGGHDVHFEMQGNTLVGYIYDHGHQETVFTLNVDHDGHYTFELDRPLDEHHQGQDSTTIDFSGIITATDGDGDKITLDNGQFTVKVVDDMPEVTCNRVGGTVEESALRGGNEDSYHDTTVAHGSLASTVSFGADGPGKFAIDGNHDALAHLAAQNHGLTSGGDQVQFKVVNGELIGYTVDDHHNSHTVFTLSVDSDGNYKFELDRPLDEHKQGEDSTSIDFSGVITATDGDGDKITLDNGQFTVKVVDDMPEVTCNQVGGTVEEDALSGGNEDNRHDTTTAHGSLASTVSFGADGPGRFAIDGNHDALAHLAAQNHGLTSGGDQVQFKVVNGELIGYTVDDHHNSHTVFTLSVDSDGNYKFELDRPLDEHKQGEDSTSIDFSGVITATDGDGDKITLDNGQFTVKVVDDMPEVTCNQVGGTVEESALPDGNRDHQSDTTTAHGSLASTVSFGADGPGKFAIDGSHDALTHLAAQNHGLTSGGDQVQFKVVNGELIGYTVDDHHNSHTVFTLSVDSDGNYKFELDRPLDEHKQGEDSTSIDFSGVITATDGDGDKITLDNGQFTVKVVDDMPEVTCNQVGGTVEEDALSGGNEDNRHDTTTAHGSLASTVSFGADGPGSFSIDDSKDALQRLEHQGLTSDGQSLHYKVDGDTLIGYTGSGKDEHDIFTLKVDGDGDYTFTLKDQLDHTGKGNDDSLNIDFSGVIKATDSDGDSVTLDNGQLQIKVVDDQPEVTNSKASGTVEEDALLGGNEQHQSDTTSAHGSLSNTVSFGADRPGSFSIDDSKDALQKLEHQGLTSDGQQLHYKVDGDTLIGYTGSGKDEHDIFTLKVDGDGDYTFTLKDQLDHTGKGNDDSLNIDFSGVIKATDSDGDSVTLDSGHLTVKVVDDTPVAHDLSLPTVQENSGQHDLGTVEDVFGGHYSAGADGLGSIKITDGNNEAHGTLTISGGHVYYTPPANVTGDKSYSFEYTVTDGDGDSSKGNITVGVKDNHIPTITHEDPQSSHPATGPGEVSVDEGHLANGTDPKQGGETVHGTFTVDGGNESVTIQIDGHDIKIDGTGNEVITDKDGLGELQVTSVTHNDDGTYTVNYDYTLDQAKHNDTGSDSADTSFKVTVTDGSGDTASGDLTVHIADDKPTAGDLDLGTVHESATDVAGKVTFDAGADHLQSIEITKGNDGSQGTLSIDNDGTVHYTAPHDVTGNQDYTFEYTVTDKDGDSVTKTITVHVDDSKPTIDQDPQGSASEVTVNEANLGDGTSPNSDALTKTGTFTVDTHGEGLGSVMIDGKNVNLTGFPQTITVDHGTLVITGITHDDNTGKDTINYSYTLGDNYQVPGDSVTATFEVSVTDKSGDAANSHLTVHVTDDAPTAEHLDLGHVDEGSGAHIGHVDFNAGADGLSSVTITSGNDNDNSQGHLDIGADGKVTYTPPADVNGVHDYTFTYEVTDKDGDKSSNTITVHVDDVTKPVLVVGENVDDNAGQTTDHHIDHAPSDQNQGEINGGDAGDVLVGDTGGKSGQIGAGDYNICLILDISTSMDETFSGSGGKSRMDVMQAAVDELLAKYADHPGDVNIKIIAFGTDVVREWDSNANGDFTSTTKDNSQTAVQFVDGLDNRGTQYTNYEAAMQAAKEWFDDVGNNGNANKAYFLSDGDPTAHLDKNDNVDKDSSPSSSQVTQYINEALGAAGSMLSTGNDGLHVDFQAIGIGSGVTESNLDKFDNSGDTTTPGEAQIVNNADDLNAALDVGKAAEPYAQGNDVINGGKGNDLIFGDQVYTESINDGNPNTIGWQNFGNMSEADIAAWLKANPDEAGKEYAGVQYGNDTLNGGDGNDTIYGQGGDDIITGGKDADQLHGGSGNDTYVWTVGDGNDTIIETAGLKDTLEIQNTDTLPVLTKVGENLIITVGDEQITVTGQFHTDSDGDATTNSAVEFIKVGGQLYQVELEGNTPILVAVNTAPVNTVPSSLVAVGDTTFNLGVTDFDTQILTITLAVDHGAITLASTDGLTFTDGHNNDGSMTFSGTQDAINAAMAGMHYIPDSNGDNAQLTMTSNDHDGHTTTSTMSITAVDADVLNLSSTHQTYSNGNTETLSHNSDFSNGQTTYNDSGSSHHISDTTTGGHIINGGGGNDWIEGGKGDDTLNGGDGNDYLDGGAGHNKYDGGAGDDVIKVTHDDLTGTQLIHGGAGNDTLDLSAVGTWDFTGTGHNGISDIEKFDLGSGGNADKATVTLDAESVLEMSDPNHTLVISGDGGDHVNLKDDTTNSWTKMDSVTNGAHTYDVYHSGSGATVLVDDHIQTQIVHHS